MGKHLPIEHWSYSSLMTYLRNPLAWYKRYVEKVYDTPSSPASFVGRAGHLALECFYNLPARERTQAGGVSKEEAIRRGLEYIRDVPDFEINFGRARTKQMKRQKRKGMEESYKRAISFYLARPPRHHVLGVEASGYAEVEGISIPVKAISDLVVRSRVDRDAVDIIDHKFVNAFSHNGANRSLFVLQALFNYYTVREMFEKPVRRFIVYECKRSVNADGKSQMRRYIINFDECEEEFSLFRRLLYDATVELAGRRVFLPNPSDMFEGENSFDIYRLGLVEK